MLGERFGEVVDRAREGDHQAFAELWRDAHPMLLRYLRVTAREAAEDVASQTWLRVIERLASFRGEEPAFRRWVVTIARNTHIDGLRRAGRRPEELVADAGFERGPSAEGFACEPDVADVVIERMSTEDALRLIATLPRDLAEIVTLRVVVGLEPADVATIVGRSPGAVRVAVHRGLRRLLTQLQSGRVTQSALTTSSGGDA